MLELQPLDFILVAIYLVGVLVLAWAAGRRTRSASDFHLGGRVAPFWVIGISLVITDLGLTDLFAGTAGAYTHGLAQANFDWIGTVPAVLVAAFLVVPALWREQVVTVPEYLGRRYGTSVRLLAAVYWLVFLAIALSMALHLGAGFLEELLGGSRGGWIGSIAIFVGLYTVVGGHAGISFTDVFQFAAFLLGGLILVGGSLLEAGGFERIHARLTELDLARHLELLHPHDTSSPFPWSGLVLGLGVAVSVSYFAGHQVMVQRFLGARSEWDARAGLLFAGFLKLLVPLIIVIPGLALVAIDPGIREPGQVLTILITKVLPVGLSGIVVVALLAALMSSLDALLHSGATIFRVDVLETVRSLRGLPALEDGGSARLARVVTALLITGVALLAPVVGRAESPLALVRGELLGSFQGPTIVVLLLGIHWKRASTPAALVALTLGVGLTWMVSHGAHEIFPSENPYFLASFVSLVLSSLLFVTVSLLVPSRREGRSGV